MSDHVENLSDTHSPRDEVFSDKALHSESHLHDNGDSDFKLQNQAVGVVGSVELIFLGIGLVIVGDTAFWNTGLGIGFYDYLINIIIVGTAFIASSLCLAEMTATFPFAGGLYGFTRVTLGSYFGFIVGCCEMLQNIVYCSAYVIFAGEIISFSLGLSHHDHDEPTMYPPLFAVSILILITIVNLIGGRIFWTISSIMSCTAIVVVSLYIFSSIHGAEFGRYALQDTSIPPRERVFHIFRFFAPTAWFYGGIEMIPLTCSDAYRPKVTVSRSIVVTSLVLFVLALCLVTVSVSLSPGPMLLQHEILPLVPGLMQTMNLSEESASALMIPSFLISAMAFIYIYGKQMRSMSESHLLPSILQYHYHRVPYASILSGSLFCVVLIVIYYFVSIDSFNDLVLISNQASYLLYLSIPASYLVFKQRYDQVNNQVMIKGFKSPFGICGAIYSLVMFVIGNVTVLTMNEDFQYLLPGFVGFFLLISLYYLLWANKRQGFSAEEQKVLFSAYIINANRRNRHLHHHHHHHHTHHNHYHNRSMASIVDKKKSNLIQKSAENNNRNAVLAAQNNNVSVVKPQYELMQRRTATNANTGNEGKGLIVRKRSNAFHFYARYLFSSKVSDQSIARTVSSSENSISYVRRSMSLRQMSLANNHMMESSANVIGLERRFDQISECSLVSDENSAGHSQNTLHQEDTHCPKKEMENRQNQSEKDYLQNVAPVRDFSGDPSSSPWMELLPLNLHTADDRTIHTGNLTQSYLVNTSTSAPITTTLTATDIAAAFVDSQQSQALDLATLTQFDPVASVVTTRSPTYRYESHLPQLLGLTRLETVSGSMDEKNHGGHSLTPISILSERMRDSSRTTGLRYSGDSSSSSSGRYFNGITKQSLTSIGTELDEMSSSIHKSKPLPSSLKPIVAMVGRIACDDET